jgi:hypothetical protein
MKIEPPRHLLIGGIEMSIGKPDPIIPNALPRWDKAGLTYLHF